VAFLAVWTAAALFALRNGALHLRALRLDEKAPPGPRRNHARRDGMDDAP